MKVLKFVARWFGPLLILFGLGFWLKGSDWPLPFPFSTVLPAAGAVITLIAWWLTRQPERRISSWFLLSGAIVGLLFCGWQYWDQAHSYREMTVSFTSRETRLVGTLFLPNTKSGVSGRVPGIVMVQGSGALPRSLYKLLGADHFARAGYAVLTYDKRGTGDSLGHYEGD